MGFNVNHNWLMSDDEEQMNERMQTSKWNLNNVYPLFLGYCNAREKKATNEKNITVPEHTSHANVADVATACHSS